MITYVGNGAYWYANSTAMLLAAGGEYITPGRVEALTGVGLGAEMQQGSTTLWFGNLASAPDIGVSKALEILGFEWTECAHGDGKAAPFDELRVALAEGPVVLGPVDMGYLSYVPYHQYCEGADHYVLAYAFDETTVYLHDPAGFPFASLPLEDLALAWRAERIGYRRGAYRSWTAPRRIQHPTDDQIYARACDWFRECYRATDEIVTQGGHGAWIAGSQAINSFAEYVRGGDVSGETRGHLVNFALALGARRALDYAAFFDGRDPDLLSEKQRQTMLFGRSHTLAVRNDWTGLAETLHELAESEEAFRATLHSRSPAPAELVAAGV